MEDRKKDHIDLAFNSQAKAVEADRRFYYEPLMGSHTRGRLEPFTFLGKTMRLPVWVSSMREGVFGLFIIVA